MSLPMVKMASINSFWSFNKVVLFLFLSFLPSSFGFNFFKNSKDGDHVAKPQHKLLAVVIDGFRWDYLERFAHRTSTPFTGFQNFMEGGVHTQFLKSVFPSESFPTWQTINTGLYPGNHGIIGKQFYDPEIPRGTSLGKGIFFDYRDQRSTEHVNFWQQAPPIWATATEQGLKISTYLWGRCDISWQDTKPINPAYCETVFQKDNSKTMKLNMERALIDFQHGFDATIVYEHGLGTEAEKYGPLSIQVEDKLRELDQDLSYFMDRLKKANMEDMVNIVLLSDHGMAYGMTPQPKFHPLKFPIEKFKVNEVSVGEALQPIKHMVSMIVGSGAYAMVYPVDEENTDLIVKQLENHLKGVQVYRKENIPEHLHWKENRKVPAILVLADRGTIIRRAGNHMQKPGMKQKTQGGSTRMDPSQAPKGISGYDPDDRDMRGVFMARGPDFNVIEEALPPIELVDIYQLLCFLMDVKPQPNDGIWDRIKAFLKNSAWSLSKSAPGLGFLISISYFVIYSSNRFYIF